MEASSTNGLGNGAVQWMSESLSGEECSVLPLDYEGWSAGRPALMGCSCSETASRLLSGCAPAFQKTGLCRSATLPAQPAQPDNPPATIAHCCLTDPVSHPFAAYQVGHHVGHHSSRQSI